MGIYPRQDYPIRICLVDNSQLEGLVNIVGRDITTFLQDTETDIVMYDTVNGEDDNRRPMIVRKSQVLWVEIKGNEADGREPVNLKPMKMKLANGQVVTGNIDITGYDRISDYFQKNSDRYAEVFGALVDGEKSFPSLFVSVTQYIWVIPDDQN